MKTIETGNITHIESLAGSEGAWYYGISYEHGDLYEAEEIFRSGGEVKGRDLILLRYPDGMVFRPLPKALGHYAGEPVFLEGKIYLLDVDFRQALIKILSFDCLSYETTVTAELPLDTVKDCYNLGLDTAPLTLTRQCVGQNEFEIIWPEKSGFYMDSHESFFLRDGDRLFFSRWYEEGEGSDYRYWEETVIRNTDGKIIEVLSGDVRLMPNGDIWHLK